MARARNIKPGFFVNDELAEIEPLGRLLFIGLWTISDREGRLKDRPKMIKAQVLPYDNCDVNNLLEKLQGKGFILRYKHGGCQYIQIINFNKHQNPHIKEQASEIPAPDIHHANTIQEPNKNGTCPADSLNPITDSGFPITDSLNPKHDAKTEQQPDKKIEYAEFVKMTEPEYEKLIQQHGAEAVGKMVAILDNYKGSKGKTYRSDYRAILSWVVDRYKEERKKAGGSVPQAWDNLREWAAEKEAQESGL